MFDHPSALLDPTHFGPARTSEGRAWIATLADRLRRASQEWGIEPEGDDVRHGYSAVILPVRRGSDAMALKLAQPSDAVAEEVRALRAWGGHGAVRLHAPDEESGALLLERLDASRPLSLIEPGEAAWVAGHLLRRLAIPAATGFRDVRPIVGAVADTLETRLSEPSVPIPAAWIETAARNARELSHDARNDRLIHSDLHYGNVLAAEREPWLAIDPRAMAGEPEQAIPELLWTGIQATDSEAKIRELFDTLVHAAMLHTERARQWAIVRCVDYWIWGLEHDLTEDPQRCRRILEVLI